MRNTLGMLLFVLLTVFCWGVYGPVLHEGQVEMGSLRPFVCVGMAYFAIAVVVPLVILLTRGEDGSWTSTGAIWSLVAGAAGAIGALGIILAFAFRGSPVYVMPLIFGGAPVVNTFLTMYMGRSFRQAGPIFIAGLMLVVAGAVTTLVFRPRPQAVPQAVEAEPELQTAVQVEVKKEQGSPLTMQEMSIVVLFTAMTIVAWGVYGPTLHKGQAAMHGSRLRPFLCVGVSYFLIAVIVPAVILNLWEEPGGFTWSGSLWSLAGGAAGAVGAIGIIMAFNFGGKPIFVMPLVFGGAPVVNTFVGLSGLIHRASYGPISPVFYAGLILVVVGAITVLVFGPRAARRPGSDAAVEHPSAEVAHT